MATRGAEDLLRAAREAIATRNTDELTEAVREMKERKLFKEIRTTMQACVETQDVDIQKAYNLGARGGQSPATVAAALPRLEPGVRRWLEELSDAVRRLAGGEVARIITHGIKDRPEIPRAALELATSICFQSDEQVVMEPYSRAVHDQLERYKREFRDAAASKNYAKLAELGAFAQRTFWEEDGLGRSVQILIDAGDEQAISAFIGGAEGVANAPTSLTPVPPPPTTTSPRAAVRDVPAALLPPALVAAFGAATVEVAEKQTKAERSTVESSAAGARLQRIPEEAVVLARRWIGAGATGRVHKATFAAEWELPACVTADDARRGLVVKSFHEVRRVADFEQGGREIVGAGLHHPKIIRVYALVTAEEDANEVAGLLMEEGRKERPEGMEPLKVALDVADALRFAHEHSVIHGDVKLANVVYATGDGPATAKLTDFGSAKLAAATLTARGTLRGTLLYMAPEVADGSTSISRASDVYSFGMMLYELYHDLTATAQPSAAWRPDIRADLDPAIRDLIAACWSHRAADRPAMDAVADELRRLWKRQRPDASDDSPPAPTRTEEHATQLQPATTIAAAARATRSVASRRRSGQPLELWQLPGSRHPFLASMSGLRLTFELNGALWWSECVTDPRILAHASGVVNVSHARLLCHTDIVHWHDARRKTADDAPPAPASAGLQRLRHSFLEGPDVSSGVTLAWFAAPAEVRDVAADPTRLEAASDHEYGKGVCFALEPAHAVRRARGGGRLALMLFAIHVHPRDTAADVVYEEAHELVVDSHRRCTPLAVFYVAHSSLPSPP